MSLLDKIKYHAGAAAQAAGSAAQTAVQQGKTLASTGRVKLAIAAEEDKLKKAYVELGRLYYRDHEAAQEPVDEEYRPWREKAADAKAQIERLNQELDKIRAEQQEPEEVDGEPKLEVDLTSQPEDTETESEQAPEPEMEAPAEPTVGTLYVDVTNSEDE